MGWRRGALRRGVAAAAGAALALTGWALPPASAATSAAGQRCTVVGTHGGDRLVGTAGRDVLCGLGGKDVLVGRGGADVLAGGRGADVLIGGTGPDRLVGGPGMDTASYVDHAQRVVADIDGAADDGSARERDRVSTDVENLRGGLGGDSLTGSRAANRLRGGPGNDRLAGLAGRDSIAGDRGDDSLSGGPGADSLTGGSGRDTATYSDHSTAVTVDLDGAADDGATGERDRVATDVEGLVGGAGPDRLTGSAAANALTGGAGEDLLVGGTGNDLLLGGSGHDRLLGQPGDDGLAGGPDDDTLDGGDGVDSLDGGTGTNRCSRDAAEPPVPTCTYDGVKPRLESLSFSTSTLDIASGRRELVASYRITDDASGYKNGSNAFYFRGPGGQTLLACLSSTPTSTGPGSSCTRTSGNDLDGTYETRLTWPANAAVGTWTLYWVNFQDAAGNVTSLSETDLAAAGLPSTITVNNPSTDTAKPTLRSLSFSTSAIDIESGPRDLVATYRITDDASGYKNGSNAFYFRGPGGQTLLACLSSTPSSTGPGTSCTRTSGNDLDGTYETRITWPANAAEGIWTLYWVNFQDAAGNVTSLSETDLAAAGLPSTITVD